MGRRRMSSRSSASFMIFNRWRPRRQRSRRPSDGTPKSPEGCRDATTGPTRAIESWPCSALPSRHRVRSPLLKPYPFDGVVLERDIAEKFRPTGAPSEKIIPVARTTAHGRSPSRDALFVTGHRTMIMSNDTNVIISRAYGLPNAPHAGAGGRLCLEDRSLRQA